MQINEIIIDYNDKAGEVQALISERTAWETRNHSDFLMNENPHYTEEDFLDMAIAFRQIAGEEVNID